MIFNRQLLKEKRDFAASFLMQENTANVFHDAADLIMDSLEILHLNPLSILELGARSGICSAKLQDFYPNSAITATDISYLFLASNPIKRQILCDDETFYLNADKKFDLVVSNLNIHHINDIEAFLLRMQNMLTPDGYFVASFFAEGSLRNFRKVLIEAEAKVGTRHYQRVIPFIRANDISQILLHANYRNVVTDINKFNITNICPLTLSRYLKNIGENCLLMREYNWTISKALYSALDSWESFSDEYFIVTFIAQNKR